jgi:hypothetical protein
MGEKNPRDMITKATWSLMEVMKDTASANITIALRGKQLKIENHEVIKLMTIVSASIEEGFHRGFRSFNKTLEAATVGLPEPAKAKKKPV